MGDIFGNFTCFTYNGCSLADYAVASPEIFRKMTQFKVHTLIALSNHCAIICSIRCPGSNGNHTTQVCLDPIPGNFLWTAESINVFTNNMQSTSTRQKLHFFPKSRI